MTKNFTSLIFVAFTFVLASLGHAQQRYVVGCPSEFDTEEVAKTVLASILELVVKAGEGDRIDVWDAYNCQLHVSLTVPRLNVRAQSAAARLNSLKEQVAALQRYVAAAAKARSGKARAIRLPQFLDEVARLAPGARVLLYGLPFYTDPRDPAFVFGVGERAGYYPSDAHLLVDSRTSPFGTTDRLRVLRSTTSVYFCYLTDALFTNDQERTAVRRFWKLYVERVGGCLADFGATPSVSVEQATLGTKEPVTQEQLDAVAGPLRLEMQRVTTIAVPTPAPDLLPAPQRPTTTTEESDGKEKANLNGGSTRSPTSTPPSSGPTSSGAAPASQPPAPAPTPPAQVPATPAVRETPRELPVPKAPGKVHLAAMWDVPADVDLWVRAPGATTELGYRTPTSTEGRYLRDIRSSLVREQTEREWVGQWEVVELGRSTLEELSNYTVWLNLYRGTGKPVSGVLRCSDGVRVVDVPFAFPADLSGNCGKDATHRELNPCWQRIDLRPVIERLVSNPR